MRGVYGGPLSLPLPPLLFELPSPLTSTTLYSDDKSVLPSKGTVGTRHVRGASEWT